MASIQLNEQFPYLNSLPDFHLEILVIYLIYLVVLAAKMLSLVKLSTRYLIN